MAVPCARIYPYGSSLTALQVVYCAICTTVWWLHVVPYPAQLGICITRILNMAVPIKPEASFEKPQ